MFVQHNVSRQYCNMLMNYIRAMLKWGILRKLVSHQVYVEAKFIPPLKKGKTRAYEKPPRQDVPDWVINQTLPHLLPTIRYMVQVQRWASMRPSEVFRMKPGEIDTGYKTDEGVVIWMYAQWDRFQELIDDPPDYIKAWHKKLKEAAKEAGTWQPGPNSWQPGDPIPEGYRQQRQERGRFPRVNQSE
jgi:hypothetical protein